MDCVVKNHSGCAAENGLQGTGEEEGDQGKGTVDFEVNIVDWALMFTFVPFCDSTKMTEGLKGMNSEKPTMGWEMTNGHIMY